MCYNTGVTKTALKFTKVKRGHYATADGRYAVVQDGYTGRDVAEDVFGGEWALVFDPHGRLREHHNDGENLAWFDTKREAVAYAQTLRVA